MDDRELEDVVRRSLRAHAGDAQERQDLAAAAHAGVRRRQRSRIGLAAAAVVAVVVPVAVVAATGGGDETRLADDGGPSTRHDGPVTASPAPVGWRVESYDGVQVRVPPDWGWGGAPMEAFDRGDEVIQCGPGAFGRPSPDGTLFRETFDMPYVGRAGFVLTDVCSNVPPPDHPYVWLGAPVEPGTVELPGGYVQETVEVGGTTVTVGSDDDRLRQTVLGSAEAVVLDANGCSADVGDGPRTSWSGTGPDSLGGLGSIASVSVCVYLDRGPGPVLGYSTSLDGAAAQSAYDAIEATPAERHLPACKVAVTGQQVLLRFHGSDGDADLLADLSCPGGGYTDGRPFTRQNVLPWVVDGVGVYVSGGMVGNALTDIFHPPPG